MGDKQKIEPQYYTDSSELIKKLTKYFIEGVVVAIVARWISTQKLSFNEIATIGLTAAATLVLLDIYSPSVSSGYRQGMGITLGALTIL